MLQIPFRLVGLTGAVVSFFVGCSELTPSLDANATRRRYTGVAGLDVFAATEQTLREEFRIETRDRARGYLKSSPKQGVARSGTGWIGDAILPGRSYVRRVAEMRVTPTADDAVVVLCKVTLERWDTDRYHAFAFNHRVDDTPGGAPDELAGGPREIWTQIGSDVPFERQLLAALEERLILMEPVQLSNRPESVGAIRSATQEERFSLR